MSPNMKAIVIHTAGGPESLELEDRPIPTPTAGQVLIKVHAFGLNRSEMFTRQGHSPGVQFPRILGIEAVGTVESAPDSSFQPGDVVATAMGGLGRDFDGGYAQYTCPPASQIQKVPSGAAIGWEVFGAMPEMFQTAYGSLFKALRLQRGETLLIRGGTTSIGLAAAALAKAHGCTVASTSRSKASEKVMRDSGADSVFVDGGTIAEEVRKTFPGGVDKVLELIGTVTLQDSLRCARVGGIVCNTGIAGGKWSLEGVNPMELIPTGVCLTVYAGGPDEFMETPVEEMAQQVKEGKLRVPIGKVFRMEDIVQAHTLMETNKAGGKIVMLTEV